MGMKTPSSGNKGNYKVFVKLLENMQVQRKCSYVFSLALTRCKVDPTVEIHSPSHENQFKFSIEAFKFIGLHDQVINMLICFLFFPLN